MPQEEITLNPDKWIDNYADYLFNYAVVRVNNSDVAKDLVQDAFFAALKSAKNFQGKSTERTWLVSILNFYDDGENEGSWLEERVPQSWNNKTEKDIENVELKNQLDTCIDNLPEKYALVFRLKTIQEFETEEICKELDITASNLWVIIHRARTQLRKCMEDNWFNN